MDGLLRILSFSDIHGDMDAYQLFIDLLEGHIFDVVIIAGDLGDIDEAKAIVSPLVQFGKPIFYVMGNWDLFSYQDSIHEDATHLHPTHRRVDDWVFLGYSGCAANQYRGNPSLADKWDEFENNKRRYKRKYGSYELFCKSIVFEELQTYIAEHPHRYRYSYFCDLYRSWARKLSRPAKPRFLSRSWGPSLLTKRKTSSSDSKIIVFKKTIEISID